MLGGLLQVALHSKYILICFRQQFRCHKLPRVCRQRIRPMRAYARAQYANFEYNCMGKTRTKKTVGWECMYITMGTAVYGYIYYEFLGLSEVL